MNWLYIHCILYSISVNNRYKLRYTKTNHYDDKVLHFIATISSLFPCAVGWVIYSWNMTVETIAKGILHVTSDNVIVSMRNCKLLWNFIIMQKHLPCRGLNLYDLVVYHSMKQWAAISFMAWLLVDNTTPKVYVASTHKHSFLFIADENELDLPCENVFSSLPNHNCMHASVSWYNDCKFCNEDHSNDTTIHDNDNNVIDNGMMMTMIMMATIMTMIMFIFTKYWWEYWYMIIHILSNKRACFLVTGRQLRLCTLLFGLLGYCSPFENPLRLISFANIRGGLASALTDAEVVKSHIFLNRTFDIVMQRRLFPDYDFRASQNLERKPIACETQTSPLYPYCCLRSWRHCHRHILCYYRKSTGESAKL